MKEIFETLQAELFDKYKDIHRITFLRDGRVEITYVDNKSARNVKEYMVPEEIAGWAQERFKS